MSTVNNDMFFLDNGSLDARAALVAIDALLNSIVESLRTGWA